MFNKESNWTYIDWFRSKAYSIMINCPYTQEDRQKWWNSLDNVDKREVLSLPNFDPIIFKECTGIDVKTVEGDPDDIVNIIMHILKELGYGDEENGADTNYMSALCDVAEKVKALPSIISTQRWIPVDYNKYPETYPKPFQKVWITDSYGEVRDIAYDGTRNIKAWMPYIIPEPYKEGDIE